MSDVLLAKQTGFSPLFSFNNSRWGNDWDTFASSFLSANRVWENQGHRLHMCKTTTEHLCLGDLRLRKALSSACAPEGKGVLKSFLWKNYPLSIPLHMYTYIGVPILAQQKRIWLVSMRTRVRSLALLSGLKIRHCRELRCRLQTRLGSRVAVALA